MIASNLQQQLANTDNKEVQSSTNEIASLLTKFFAPDLDSKERTEIRKKISFLYRTSIEPALGIAPPHIPKGKLFPLEILQGTRDYIERIGQQANGCYELGWYDACAVMLRRLLETLIIECYEHHKIDATIKGGDGNFLQLRDLIAHFLNEKQWNPTRNTRNGLPKLKDIGDLSAHSRRYIAQKPDIENIQKELRVVIQELVYLAGFDKTPSL